MFTKFKNVSFIASSVTGLEVEMNVLHILTTGQSYEVRYETKEEAVLGLEELTAILNGTVKTPPNEPEASKVDELKASLTEGLSRLQSFLDTGKASAKDSITDAVLEKMFGQATKSLDSVLSKKDDLLARAASLLETLEQALDADEKPEPKPMATRNDKPVADAKEKAKEKPEVKPMPVASFNYDAVEISTPGGYIVTSDCIFTSPSDTASKAPNSVNPKKLTPDEFKVLFGTSDEPVVGDFSERQLREFISEFVENALSNERVQQLFQNIKDNFGADEAEGAIEGYKNLILTICLQNVEMTLSQIIAQYFSS